MAPEPWTDGNVFSEINDLRAGADEKEEGINLGCCRCKQAPYNDTCWATIAANKAFEIITLSVIVINALFIGYDTDYVARYSRPDNLYDEGMPIGFPIMENFFCVYFTLELLIRFMATANKLDCFFDSWFMFDSVLVFFMLLENALAIVGGDMPIDLSIFRLLRLLRISRMGKLINRFPELRVIVKSMAVSIRTVSVTTLGPLTMIVYVFAILFTDSYHQGEVPDGCIGEEETSDDCPMISQDELDCANSEDAPCSLVGAHLFFGSMGKSVRSLIIMGTILDDMTACTNAIRASGGKAMPMLMVFFVFVLVSSFTMFNMVVGLLVEVVNATSAGEEEAATENAVKEAIANVFESLDVDHNGTISRKEFVSMKHDKKVLKALSEMEVESKHFDVFADLMFAPGEDGAEPAMTLEDTVSMINRLRPGSKVGALDFASFQQFCIKNHGTIRYQISRIDKMMSKVIDYDPDEGKDCSPEAQQQLLDLKEMKQSGAMTSEEYHAKKEELLRNEKQAKMVVSDLDNFNTEDIYKEVLKRNKHGEQLPPDPSGMLEMLLAAYAVMYPQKPVEEPDDFDGEAWSKETYTC